MKISDSHILITGVSSGIGLALARRLLESGAKVAGWSRRDPNIEDENFCFIQTDITSADAVARSGEKTIDFFDGKIDGLINNAGIGIFKIMEDLSVEEWKKMFDVNVHGIFYTAKFFMPLMKKQQRGHFINIASIAGKEGLPEATGYCGTKFAVSGISKALYREVKKYNVKVSCVYPGSVNTAFFENYQGVEANETMLHPDEVAKLLIQLLETPENFNTSELEIRPMNVKYT